MKKRLKYIAGAILDWRFPRWLVSVVDHRSENRMAERGMLAQAFEFIHINAVEGDYFEFGLWRGKTFCYAHSLRRRHKMSKMKLWGFDSFQGLPTITEQEDNVWQKGDFACSEPELQRILVRSGFKPSEYILVPGFYETSLNDGIHQRIDNRKAAIVYVDCDLYESTLSVLEFVHRYFMNGTVICFDDWYNYKGRPDKGEQLALKEFLDSHAQFAFIPYMNYSPLGKSFIIHLKT